MMENERINPYAPDAKKRRLKNLSLDHEQLVIGFASFHYTGSITGMKKQYYGKGALLVKCGNYIYNVTNEPKIYFEIAN